MKKITHFQTEKPGDLTPSENISFFGCHNGNFAEIALVNNFFMIRCDFEKGNFLKYAYNTRAVGFRGLKEAPITVLEKFNFNWKAATWQRIEKE